MSSLSTFSHAPSLFLHPSSSTNPSCARTSRAASARIAVVNDVPDLVLLQAGDFGNENVELFRSVADLKFPKAVILGNHDSWTTQKFSATLGEEHVGCKRLDFPTLKLSIVDGRPFSSGGAQLFNNRLLFARYGVQDMNVSARKIYNAALGNPEDHSVIFLAYYGPIGE